jgi:hypothetical protein
MAKTRKSPIDGRSDEIVLAHVEGAPAPLDVPERDLNGGDLHRIAYARALSKWDGEGDRPADEFGAGDLRDLADELEKTGSFTYDVPKSAAPAEDADQDSTETPSDGDSEPAAPAEG